MQAIVFLNYQISYVVLAMVTLCLIRSARPDNECHHNGAFLYEDLDCEPLNPEAAVCATSYNCSTIYANPGCFYKGRNYLVGEVIESNLSKSVCCSNCRCICDQRIVCQPVVCGWTWWGWDSFTTSKRNCFEGFTLGECCPRQICPKNTITNKICEVDGKNYKIGEKFVPKHTCLSCVCHENFTGEFNNETCMKQTCNLQLKNTLALAQNCAPVYLKVTNSDVLCCPDFFVCPNYRHKIRLLDREGPETSGLECLYGNKKVKLGYGFLEYFDDGNQNRFLKCRCVLPPLLTCTEI